MEDTVGIGIIAAILFTIICWVRSSWQGSRMKGLFDQGLRFCHCGGQRTFDGVHGDTYCDRCLKCHGRSTLPLSLLTEHVCTEDDLVPRREPVQDGSYTFQDVRCRMCGLGDELIDGFPSSMMMGEV